MQKSLFDAEKGRRLRDRALDRIASHNQVFLFAARRQAVIIAQTNGSVTIDDLREWAEREGREPDHPNVWGSVFKSCPLTDMKWECFEVVRSRVVSNHARRIGHYRLAPTEKAAA